jgi:hypothetical protein
VTVHPSFDPVVQERRQAEFDKAASAYEVKELHARWAQEDVALAALSDLRSQEIAELRGRVAQLERMLGPHAETLTSAMAEVIGHAIGSQRRELDARIAEIENRQLKFMGVHEAGRAYKANSLVIRKGGLWCALTDTVTPPGTDDTWQLAVKSGEVGRAPGHA